MIRHFALSMVLAVLIGIGAARSLAQGGPGVVIAVSDGSMPEKPSAPRRLLSCPVLCSTAMSGFRDDVHVIRIE
jgi:hypothetical protein